MAEGRSRGLDRATFEALYRQCGFQVEHRCRALLGDADAAADAAQEVFMRVLTRGDRFRGEAQWMTWLYRVATNVCLNRLRDRKNRQRLLDLHGDTVHPAPLPSPGAVVHRDALTALAGHFDDKTLEIATYYFVDEMSQEEIGALVGLSRVSVNKRLMKFRTRARQLLAAEEAA